MTDFTAAKYGGVFAHPLMSFVWPDAAALNPELKARILAQERDAPGEARSNIGGWHSKSGLLEFCGEAGRTLVGRMREMTTEATLLTLSAWQDQQAIAEGAAIDWTVDAWANVNRAGDFNSAHTHGGSTWSGTYYVDVGEPPPADGPAPLQLLDPCQGRANTFLQRLAPTSYVLPPEPGLMILFPSYIPHMVFPHKGGGTRISIAFNMRREPFP